MYRDHTVRPIASAAILVELVGLGLNLRSFSPSCGYIKILILPLYCSDFDKESMIDRPASYSTVIQ